MIIIIAERGTYEDYQIRILGALERPEDFEYARSHALVDQARICAEDLVGPTSDDRLYFIEPSDKDDVRKTISLGVGVGNSVKTTEMHDHTCGIVGGARVVAPERITEDDWVVTWMEVPTIELSLTMTRILMREARGE